MQNFYLFTDQKGKKKSAKIFKKKTHDFFFIYTHIKVRVTHTRRAYIKTNKKLYVFEN